MSQNNKEKHSEEIQELLGLIPGWILRFGISFILSLLCIIFIFSYFFQFPDIITLPITITNDNPPVKLVSRSTGKICKLFVADKDTVQEGESIIVIENLTDYEEYIKVKNLIEKLRKMTVDSIELVEFDDLKNLGELRTSYFDLQSRIFDYKYQKKNDISSKTINNLITKKDYQRDYLLLIKKQQQIKKQQLNIEYQSFKRDSILYYNSNNMMPLIEYENSYKRYLSEKSSYMNLEATINSITLTILQIQQELLETKSENDKTLIYLEQKIEIAFENLINEVLVWEYKYLVVSPIEGNITFTEFWSKNQTIISVGSRIATIVPFNKGNIIGKVNIPSKYLGKIKEGLKANIKLAGFPYTEYGILRGKVFKISLIPDDKGYYADILLENSLVTSYNEEISFIEEMNGNVDIITEERSLFQLFFNPIKSSIKNN